MENPPTQNILCVLNLRNATPHYRFQTLSMARGPAPCAIHPSPSSCALGVIRASESTVTPDFP